MNLGFSFVYDFFFPQLLDGAHVFFLHFFFFCMAWPDWRRHFYYLGVGVDNDPDDFWGGGRGVSYDQGHWGRGQSLEPLVSFVNSKQANKQASKQAYQNANHPIHSRLSSSVPLLPHQGSSLALFRHRGVGPCHGSAEEGTWTWAP
jgi:hypothetical protein